MKNTFRIVIAFVLLLLAASATPSQTKLQNLTPTTSTSSTDVLYVVINPGTTPADRKITIDNLFKARTGNQSLTAYASLSAAISAIGSSQAVVEIPATTTVSATLTSPSNITLSFTGSGQISVSSGQTLTINGPIEAPLRQIFTGSGSVRFGNRVNESYPLWFGAAENNSTDDTNAIQAAINAFTRTNLPHAGGVVKILGGSVISDTLEIYNTSVTIQGPGWGISQEAPYRGFIRWNGSAGIPMLLFRDCYNSGPENIRLIGKSSAKPSAAVEYNRSVSATVQADNNFARHLWVGSYFGYDSDNNRQFDIGILFSGTIDNDTNKFEMLSVVQCDVGIDIANQNSSVTEFNTVGIGHCGIGMRVGARVTATNVNLGVNDLDFEMVAQVGRLTLNDVTSEGAGQFALIGVGSELYVNNWGYQVSASTPVSGVIISADNGGSRLEIRNGLMNYVPGYSGAIAKIKQRNSGGAGKFYLRIENVLGLSKENLDLQTVGEGLSAQHEVIINRPPNGAHDWGVNDHVYLTDGDNYEEGRNDFASKVNVFGGPFKVRQIVAPSNVTAVAGLGSGATTYSYKVVAKSGSGKSLPSSAVTCTNAATLDATHYNIISAYPVLGADAYEFYGRVGGSELLLGTVYAYQVSSPADNNSVVSFKDNGSITPSGALPTTNTTGQIQQPDGASGAPSYAFASDPTAGFRRGSGYSAIVQGGNELFRWLDGGNIVSTFGDVGIPSGQAFTFSGRSQIKSPADSQITLNNSAGTSSVILAWGSGTPEGVVTAAVGSMYLRTNGGAGTTLYIKESGTGNTGWTAK